MILKSLKYLSIVYCFAFVYYPTHLFSQPLQIEPSSSYLNNNLQYEMVGYEKRNNRFWVVMKPEITQSQKNINDIILDIYQKHKEKLNLNFTNWNISFFSNKAAVGYKKFKTDEYLGEYYSCNSPEAHYKNKVYIYPTNKQKVKWYWGPNKFNCLK